jgi:predicted RNA-binding Zn-ribbon protein involved in translation (DUF1610 family)
MGTTDVMVPQMAEPTQALTPRDVGGVMGLALMTEREFEARLEALKTGQERVRRIQRDLMAEGEDFGKIPGAPKPTLLKPGAEKLCAVYGLKATFQKIERLGDGVTSPHLRIAMTCRLHQGSEDGPVVAQGEGAANSWETKHRYRSGKRTCPACGSEGTIRKSKYPDKKTGDIGWWCKDENCKANFRSDDPAITEQVVGTVDNPDPFDVENTLVKMALKRAFIDATLRATATSGLFSQDLEDMQAEDRTERRPATRPAPAGPPPTPLEPGADDGMTDQERAAYGKHGVEPPVERTSGAASGVNCPKCGTPGKPQRFQKPGKTHFCPSCAYAWEPSK